MSRLLKTFDTFRCRLAGRFTRGFIESYGVPDPKRKKWFGVEPPAKSCSCFRLTKTDDLSFAR